MIDAHHHFWHPARGDYGWMPPDDPILTRTYGPAELAPTLSDCGITGTVLVQAAPSWAETEYMLGLADATPFVRGVVGWVDADRPEDAAVLARLARHPALKAIRPMIQDIPDPDWMLGTDRAWLYEALIDHDLAFDMLGFPRHLAPFAALMDRHPTLRCVIDHGMKPGIAAQGGIDADGWAKGMTALAERGAWCKLSGLVTEAGADWTAEQLKPYVAHLIDLFGPDRLLWGSDWPVCRLASEYQRWLETAQTLVADLAPEASGRIFDTNASAFYRL